MCQVTFTWSMCRYVSTMYKPMCYTFTPYIGISSCSVIVFIAHLNMVSTLLQWLSKPLAPKTFWYALLGIQILVNFYSEHWEIILCNWLHGSNISYHVYWCIIHSPLDYCCYWLYIFIFCSVWCACQPRQRCRHILVAIRSSAGSALSRPSR